MKIREEFPSLTALRGIAALIVMLYHFVDRVFGVLPQPIARGYLAVDFFFLLSGFVLTHAHGETFASDWRVGEFARFLWARFARIYPVHLLTLALLLPMLGAPHYSQLALLYNLLLMHGPWLSERSFNDPSWSISAEWHAYLLFPFIVGITLRCGRPYAAGLGLAMLGIVATASIVNNYLTMTNGPAVFARALPEFTIGILLYRAFRSGTPRTLLATDGMFMVCAGLVAADICCDAADWLVAAALAATLLAAAHNRGWTSRLLETRPLHFLGEISYSLYMIHLFAGLLIDSAARAGISPGVSFVLAVGSSLLAATVISRSIEYPARAVLRRLFPLSYPPAGVARSLVRGW